MNVCRNNKFFLNSNIFSEDILLWFIRAVQYYIFHFVEYCLFDKKNNKKFLE